MPRYIDADALLAHMRECERPLSEDDGRSIWATGWAWSFIENAPTIDAVPVVRCGECVHSDTYPPGADNSMTLKCLGIRYGGVYPDWYCEHGQRREEEHNASD